jgi:hypothetical protein
LPLTQSATVTVEVTRVNRLDQCREVLGVEQAQLV